MAVELGPIDFVPETRPLGRTRQAALDEYAGPQPRQFFQPERLVMLEPARRRSGKREMETQLEPASRCERGDVDLGSVRFRDGCEGEAVLNPGPANLEPEALDRSGPRGGGALLEVPTAATRSQRAGLTPERQASGSRRRLAALAGLHSG